MQENHLFEYAVIRIVPRVEREEFLNAGVILYCSELNFLESMLGINYGRIQAFCDELDLHKVEEHLLAIQRICAGGDEAGPIGKLDLASRFRWLTATRSTVVQTSQVHPGFCIDARETLVRLFTQLVL